jgi:hypothetical protein
MPPAPSFQIQLRTVANLLSLIPRCSNGRTERRQLQTLILREENWLGRKDSNLHRPH